MAYRQALEISGKLAQFMTPALLGIAICGASETFTKVDPKTKDVLGTSQIYLQNAALWYVPLIIIMTILCWWFLRSVLLKASFKEQLGFLKRNIPGLYNYICDDIRFLCRLISCISNADENTLRKFEGAPDPLKYAFYGPLIGSASRVLFGFISDKTGGAILTTITGIGLIIGCTMLITMGLVAPASMEQFPMFVAVMLGLFSSPESETLQLFVSILLSSSTTQGRQQELSDGLLLLLHTARLFSHNNRCGDWSNRQCHKFFLWLDRFRNYCNMD